MRYTKSIFLISILCILSLLQCKSTQGLLVHSTTELKIEQIAKGIYLHTSYLDIPNYGKFPCNGMIYIHQKEAMIFDSPTENVAALELINWVENEKKASIKGIVVNHFHVDCLGGLQAFHDAQIPSYASEKTILLAQADKAVIPQNGFKEKLQLKIGNATIHNQFFGAAHTHDNIVSWIPKEKVLFGGCMIKSLNASKGNLKDANTATWSNSVQNIKNQYPDAQIVIPGHGKYGGIALLDYTIKLFQE